METDPEKIDYSVVKLRIQNEMKGMGMREWAERLGISPTAVSNVHGKKGRQRPSFNYMLRVSLITKKPVEYFLWGDEFYDIYANLGAFSKENQMKFSLNPDCPEMGRRVKYMREDRGYSLEEVSERADLPIQLIKKIEAGHHTATDCIVKLADALRCSADFILGCGAGLAPKIGGNKEPEPKI